MVVIMLIHRLTLISGLLPRYDCHGMKVSGMKVVIVVTDFITRKKDR